MEAATTGELEGRPRPFLDDAESDQHMVHTHMPQARVAMDAGVHSIWISEQLEQLGHEVTVANVRELRAISHSDR